MVSPLVLPGAEHRLLEYQPLAFMEMCFRLVNAIDLIVLSGSVPFQSAVRRGPNLSLALLKIL
jgi:hypothetical protein